MKYVRPIDVVASSQQAFTYHPRVELFESDVLLVLEEEVNEWLLLNEEALDSLYTIHDIKYQATPTPGNIVIYSALVHYTRSDKA
jgi:hypothetical protein